MGEYNEVYQRARYYDIAFRRDVSREVDFLTQFFSDTPAGRCARCSTSPVALGITPASSPSRALPRTVSTCALIW